MNFMIKTGPVKKIYDYKKWLVNELEEPYMLTIRRDVEFARSSGLVIPEPARVFDPLFSVKPWDVRVVLVVSEPGGGIPECDREFVMAEVMRNKWPEFKGNRSKVFRAGFNGWASRGCLVIPVKWTSVGGEWRKFTERVVSVVDAPTWWVADREAICSGENFGWYS